MSRACFTGLLIGNRIPKDYIMTKGFGDTDIGWGDNPWEVGSFDTARQMAGIENFNIVRYTSIIPPEATEISMERARVLYHPGAVMEAIIAQTNGRQDERVCAGGGSRSGGSQMAFIFQAMLPNIWEMPMNRRPKGISTTLSCVSLKGATTPVNMNCSVRNSAYRSIR